MNDKDITSSIKVDFKCSFNIKHKFYSIVKYISCICQTITKTESVFYFLFLVIIIFSYCDCYGCGYWDVDKFYTQTKVKDTFSQLFQNDSLRADNKYECALKCSSYEDANYIVYFKTVCQCVVNLGEDLKLDTIYNTCVNKCSSFYDHYCQGDTGLLVFAIERAHTAQTEEISNVSLHGMYSMSTLTCLIIAKGVYTTKQVAYCKRKLDNFYCDDKQNSIIFRLNNKYLQWICYNLQDHLGQPYFRVISRVNNENATAASHKPDNITHMFKSTTTPVLAGLSRTENNAIIICNCVLFLLILLVWIILYLKHFRQRKQDTTLKKRTSSTRQEETLSTRQEQTSATSQSPRTSNYEQISEVIIARPFHITNETYSDTCVPE